MRRIICLALLLLCASPAFGLSPGPGGVPDYFGATPNWALSPAPTVVGGVPSGGIRKFVDKLPGLGPAGANGLVTPGGDPLGQYIPVAVPVADPRWPGSDYYEIELGQYTEKMHSDLPPTTLRGYRQTNSTNPTVNKFHYLGPVIVAQKDRPVRIKFTNNLPPGANGNLFIPVDTTIMGAGPGPNATDAIRNAMPEDQICKTTPTLCYTQNRATLHLHGGTTPWISDGTTHQWITPATDTTAYPKGVSVYNVPDMPNPGKPVGPLNANDPGRGVQTFYYTNEQSARLMFYHDHASGITRLNVYAGEAAGYVLQDPTENALVNGGSIGTPPVPVAAGTIPAAQIPLVIQDRTFVDAATIPTLDPTWNWGKTPGTPNTGDLWFPHVYMTNQNPWDITGANPLGRWDYGAWFWPPYTGLQHGQVPNPYCLPTPPASPTATTWNCSASPGEPPFIPGVPNPSNVPEAFMDTPIINGTVYPTLTVDPKPYRLRILNACDDRFMNLQLWQAATGIVGSITVNSSGSGYTIPPNVTITGDGTGATARANIDPTTGAVTSITLVTVGKNYTTATAAITTSPFDLGTIAPATATANVYTKPTEVGMLPFNQASGFPPSWGFPDGRDGGVPDPLSAGPSFIQIGTEGGFLPAPYVVPNRPVNYTYNRRNIVVLSVQEKALFLGPAERADVVVDFSKFGGKTLILYNDAPAPVPALDPRIDYYTGAPDFSVTTGDGTGGAPSPLPGYGPNTRTIMQIKVNAGAGTPFNLAALQTALPVAFAASQEPIIVPQAAYNPVYGTSVVDTPGVNISNIQGKSMTFTPLGQATPILFNFEPKAIQELFTTDYGRMNATLGVEIPNTNAAIQTTIPYGYNEPPTEVIKITDPAITPEGSAADGTQLWKITHNGVDTHAIHFHMFHVQVVNRMGWDGAITPPDPNELGWKDTVRMNPLEDILVALRPIALTLPFKVPNSFRPMAPQFAIGSTIPFVGLIDPAGNLVTPTIQNTVENFGWEYVWHCHLLGHEENDMMRAMVLASIPEAPGLNTPPTKNGLSVTLNWVNNSLTANGFTVQRSPNPGFPNNASLMSWTLGNVLTFTDSTTKLDPNLYYRVFASNTVGSTVPGYPTATSDSLFSNTGQVKFLPKAAVSPATLAFGNQPVGTVSAPKTLTLSNTGGEIPLTFSIAMNGANFGDFAQSNTCGGTVAPNGTCTISVTFKPTAAGARNASLGITTNDPANPLLSVGLSGTGTVPIANVSRTTIPFGNQPVGTTSAAQNVILSNTGAAPMTFSIAMNGANSGDFAQSNTCNGTVAAGGTCTISVTFKPTAAGVRNASLNITTNDPAKPLLSVGLSGTGTVPIAGISRTTIPFGNQPVGTASAAQTAILSNTGAAPLTFAIAMNGANPGDFAQSNTCNGTVPITGTCTISVTFTPTALGARSANMNITTNDPLKPLLTVLLSGTGTPSPPAAPTNLVETAVRLPVGDPLRLTQDLVTLTWSDNSNNETGFEIQQGRNANFTGLATYNVGANVTTFTLNVPRVLSYYYRVRAVNASGNSAWSNVTFVRVP
jgi:FtsP/CotA-like multicopper oxidase with cupredoxin domain